MDAAPSPPAAPPATPPAPADAAEVHAVARLCHAPVADALALLATADGLARWNLGLGQTREVAPQLFAGVSAFGGGAGVVRVVTDAAAGIVEYHVGSDVAALVPRILARVQPGPALGYAAGTCVVSLLAWRPAGMDAARWHRLKVAHEAEIEIIRCELERRGGGRAVAAGR